MTVGITCIRKIESTDYICYAIYNVGAESAPYSQSANNDKKQRKWERERARYAAMSQEQKNARNLRQREARQKKKVIVNSIFVSSALHIYSCIF